MSIVYATSFIPSMWSCSASRLLASFIATRSDGKLYAYTESFKDGFFNSAWEPTDRISIIPLHSDNIAKFLSDNSSVIPVHLGGTFDKCSCPQSGRLQAKHNAFACPGWWWNWNAFRWMRKAVVLQHVASQVIPNGVDKPIVVWIDADTYFIERLTEQIVLQCFRNPFNVNEASVFYLKNRRTHPETSVVGYNLSMSGGIAIARFLERYMSGIFRQDQRWDDCWQLMQVLSDNDIPSVDIATGVGQRSQVLPHSPLGRYIVHDKGSHKRSGII